MGSKKKVAKTAKAKRPAPTTRRRRVPRSPAFQPDNKEIAPAAPAAAADALVSAAERICAPMQAFRFGSGANLFPTDRPILGGDVDRMKNETGYDLNSLEASLGISRRPLYYTLIKDGAHEPLPDVAMSILMRLYERFPRELLPFQPLRWADYLTMIGVQPGEFAQLVGRDYNAGRTWEQNRNPTRTVQLILEAFARAGVNSTSHPVYQEFLQIARREAELRGKPLKVRAPLKRRQRPRTRGLVEADASLMTPVED